MTTTTDTRPDTPAPAAVSTAAREVATVDRAELDAPTKGALALRGDQNAWTEDQYAALVQMGIENAGPAHLKVFLHVAQRTRLDPFSRQIYMISRRVWDEAAGRKVTKWTIQTGIDGFRIIADRRPEYRGQTKPEWCGDDGVWRDVWLAKEPPAAARIGVYRSDFKDPIYVVCTFREFAQYKANGTLTSMWATKSSHMLAKCAEAGALRKAFPNDLGGLYTDDEMPAEGITFEGDHDNDEGGVTADDLTGGVVDAEVVEDTNAAATDTGTGVDASPADTGSTGSTDGTDGSGGVPELSEDEAIAFAQYCEELPGVTTEQQVRRAWAEAHASNWLNRPVPGGDGERVGDVLTAVIRELKQEKQEEER